MKRLMQVIGVRPERFQEYCDLHEHIWPEVADAIRQAHLENYTIFHLQGKLYQYMEYTGEDMQKDLRKLSRCEAMLRWCAVCRRMQLPDSGKWEDAEEVFHQP